MSDNIITFACFSAIWASVYYISDRYIYKEKKKAISPMHELGLILHGVSSAYYGIICMNIYDAMVGKFELINNINTFSAHILPICMFSLGIAYSNNFYWKNAICIKDDSNSNDSSYYNSDNSLSDKQHKLKLKVSDLTEQCDTITSIFDATNDCANDLKNDITNSKNDIMDLKNDIIDLKKRTVEFEKVLMCPVKMNLLHIIENDNKQVIDAINQIIVRLNNLESYCVNNGTIQIGI